MTGLIAHEWMETNGGAERVVEAMLKAFPDSELFCLWNDPDTHFAQSAARESWLARTPLRRHKALAVPFMPGVWRNLDASAFDWVLVSSHLFAHQLAAGKLSDVPHYTYVHTPARYLWASQLDHRAAAIPRWVLNRVRAFDRARAQSPSELAANSEYVRERIQRAWNRESRVIYPPVEVTLLQSIEHWAEDLHGTEFTTFESLPSDFVLGASRFVDYKRLDTVIALGVAAGVPVVLAGTGADRARLESLAAGASVPVSIIDSPSDAMLRALYQRAKVFVYPAVEDFGIMPVEAMALGTPVLTSMTGGAAESTRMAGGGLSVDFADISAAVSALDAAASLDMTAARKKVGIFSKETFVDNIRAWVSEPQRVRAPS